MNIPHQKIKVDIYRLNHLTVDLIGHINDKNTRYLDLQLTANDELIELEQGCTASVTYTADNILIAQEVSCDIENNVVIIGFDSEKVENSRSGILAIQPKVTDGSGNILTLQIPIYVRVSADIAQTSQIDGNSYGSYAEVVQEIAAARGNHQNLKARLDNTAAPTDEQVAEALDDYLDEHPVDVSGKADKATTLSGYGITDAYTKSYIDQKLLELGGANVVSSVSEMTDTSRLYVLASTGHIWRYATVTAPPPNELDVKYYNRRISSNSDIDGTTSSGSGCFINEKIPVDLTGASCVITFKNFAANMGTLGTNNYENSRICALDENETLLGGMYISRRSTTSEWACPVSGDDCAGDAVTFAEQLITNGTISAKSEIKYLVLAPQISDSAISSADVSDLGIYVSTHSGTSSEWTDTGITYGGGNEEALTALDTRMTAAESSIAELASKEPSAAVVPSYWQTEVEDTITKIKTLQDAGGNDLLCFGWCSDMHIPVNGTAYEQNIGAVAAKVMKECDIPLFLMTGDVLTADTGTALANMPAAYKKAWEYLAPIGKDKLLIAKGNHDAWAGNDGNGNYYVKGLPPEKLYNLLFRSQSNDLRREFGPGGSYFYIDCKSQKTRVICLNSQWAVYEENQDGTAKYTTQKGAGFGQAQLEWLANTALNADSGYSVIVAQHTPPSKQLPNGVNYLDNPHSRDMAILRGILTAYCGKTTYSGTYTHSDKGAYLQEGAWADVIISCDFTSYNGTLLGVFCGHTHYDQYVSDGIGAPIVCITSAINTPYDTQASVRVLGTKDETVMDFVCVNRSTGDINLVRCGYGSDRTISAS